MVVQTREFIQTQMVWKGGVYQAWDKHIMCGRDTGNLP